MQGPNSGTTTRTQQEKDFIINHMKEHIGNYRKCGTKTFALNWFWNERTNKVDVKATQISDQ